MSDTCLNCQSNRIVAVSAKSSDMNVISLPNLGHEIDGDVPSDMGIGGGDYIEFSYCLDCGQLQGDFPLDKTNIEVEAVGDGVDEEI